MSTATATAKQPLPSRWWTMNFACYSEVKKLPNGSCAATAAGALDAGGHLWRVAYYPNGRLPGTTDAASLFLLLDGAGDAVAGEDVRVEYRFALHELGGADPPRFASPTAAGVASRRQRDVGFERFISLRELEKLGFSEHDGFTIRVEIAVLPKTGGEPAAGTPPAAVPHRSVTTAATPPPARRAAPPEARAPPPFTPVQPSVVPPPPPPPPSTSPEPPVIVATPPSGSGLPADLGRLLAAKEKADVVFQVSGKAFAAHKLVLAARSPVFKADFAVAGPANAATTTTTTATYIPISDVHPDAFEALLHFIYTDSLPAMKLNSREEGVALAEGLLVAAARYGVKDLTSATEKKMCSHVGVSTVLPMLALAERHRCGRLKSVCLEFMASRRNTRAVMATGEVELLARSCPAVVREVVAKILDAREATPSDPLIISVDPLFYVFACICVFPFALLALLWVLFL
ncbi:hypothetical protein ACP4OV_011827 [Aristida adscensionis]